MAEKDVYFKGMVLWLGGGGEVTPEAGRTNAGQQVCGCHASPGERRWRAEPGWE